ncbi:MAG: sulfotransferase family 2 domain-containing protein [Leptolyngbya sp. SIO1D8]|nr:sulfotransferase family 2 domain-containing protein [Leptolyngbya sp. SIO1D8]
MVQLKSVGQALLRQNFDTTLSYHRARLWLQGYSRHSKLLIYQMGKVGSTSILQAVKAELDDEPIYHVHFLAPDKVVHKLQVARKAFPKKRYIMPEIMEADYIRRQLDNHPEQIQDWKIITLLRDPIARRVSAFFQEIEVPKSLRKKLENSEFRNDFVQTLVKRFLDNWLNLASEPYHWFNSELKANFGFDIFAYPFDKKQGYQIYTPESGPKVLCFQLEKLSDCASEAFQTFMGIENLSLSKANVGSEKSYATLYKQFKATLRLPHDFVEAVYSSPHMAHFYSPEEISRFRHRWQTD